MGYLNKVMLIGNLGQEPEKKTTQSGTSVVNISLATTEYFKDSSGNRQERTEWHRVVLWGRLADIISQYTHKGSPIFVEGSLRTNEWQDRDGNKRYTTEIVASGVQLLGSSGQNQGGTNYRQASQKPQQSQDFQEARQTDQSRPPFPQNQPPSSDNDFIEDDIPF